MVGVRDAIRMSARVGLVLALLALMALLAACAAPSGANGQATGSQSGAQAAATSAPAATEAPAATTAPAATSAPAATDAPAATAAPAATEGPAAAAPAGVSFSKDVMPIFETSCIKCHGGSDGTKGGLSLKTHGDMMKGGEDGAAIVPGDAAGSLLVKQIQNGKMPKRGQKLPQEQIDLIAKWVTEGANNN